MFEALGLRGKKPFTGPTAHLRPHWADRAVGSELPMGTVQGTTVSGPREVAF